MAGIADRSAGSIDPVENRGLRNDASLPDRGQELVLTDHAVPVLDQVNKEIEDLRLDCDQRSASAQFAASCVEHTIFE
jgi:hypothetical protein